MQVLDYNYFINLLNDKGMQDLAKEIPSILDKGFSVSRFGDIPRWREELFSLPDLEVIKSTFNEPVVKVSIKESLSESQLSKIRKILMGLHPWRKGPFEIAGISIDTEWRSDFKWSRIKKSINNLNGKRVLDVGCGSGYHCWRMLGEGADLVLGIDPSPLFVFQFWVLQKYFSHPRVCVLPTKLESLPKRMKTFDTVFSMGVLYHRRSPFDHLKLLQDVTIDGGQVVLETLVIEGGKNDILIPEGRYSNMGNVWFIPSIESLCNWLRKMKFKNIEVIDVSVTSIQEQRSTKWMTFNSLSSFLDQNDQTKTIEGYPAPRRAIISAIV